MLGGLKTQLIGDKDLGMAADQVSLPDLMALLRARQARDVAAADNYSILDGEMRNIMIQCSLAPLTMASAEQCQRAATMIIDLKSKWTDLGQAARVGDKILRDYYTQTAPTDANGESRLREEMEALPTVDVTLEQWFQAVLPLVAKRAKYLAQVQKVSPVSVAAYAGQPTSAPQPPSASAKIHMADKKVPFQRKMATPEDLMQWSKEWMAGHCGDKCKIHPELAHPLIECDVFQRQYRAMPQGKQDAAFLVVLNAGLVSRYTKSS